MTGARLKLPKPQYDPNMALGSTSLTLIYAKLLKNSSTIYQYVQQFTTAERQEQAHDIRF
jgi:hypothetical protein